MHHIAAIPDGVPRCGFTVNEFCSSHRISRTVLYDLWKAGRGPRRMATGTISVEAAADWRRAQEAPAEAK